MKLKNYTQIFLLITLGLAAVAFLIALVNAASQIDIPGPPGSEEFGGNVTLLPNDNFVVIDPFYDEGNLKDIGAVYHYDGVSGD